MVEGRKITTVSVAMGMVIDEKEAGARGTTDDRTERGKVVGVIASETERREIGTEEGMRRRNRNGWTIQLQPMPKTTCGQWVWLATKRSFRGGRQL
jgi:hypothetical protein